MFLVLLFLEMKMRKSSNRVLLSENDLASCRSAYETSENLRRKLIFVSFVN